MRKLSLKQLLASGSAFVVASAATSDAALLLADRTGVLEVEPDWYLNAPLGLWVLAGIPVTIAALQRITHQVSPHRGRITGFAESSPSPLLRSIPFSAGGRRGTLLASSAPFIFGESIPQEGREYRPAAWRVPVATPKGEADVTVRETELRAFLDVCHKRKKHQFSRPYWTQSRRPPLWRPKYEAFMRLLTEADLIEGRHAQGGASGWLVTKPRHAIAYLKHESPFAVKPA